MAGDGQHRPGAGVAGSRCACMGRRRDKAGAGPCDGRVGSWEPSQSLSFDKRDVRHISVCAKKGQLVVEHAILNFDVL